MQVGDGAATGRMVGGGGQRTQSRRRGLFQEGADALGLLKEGLHGSNFISEKPRYCVDAVVLCAKRKEDDGKWVNQIQR